MKRWVFILGIICFSLLARASVLARASCSACHGPRPEDKSCVRCHSPGLKVDRSVLYGKAPILTARYTRSGLLRFLRSPQDRWKGRGSMFALTEPQLKTISEFIRSNPQDPAPPRHLLANGQKLFTSHACIQCHSGQGPGPVLQMGYPFLNQKYFAERVRRGKGSMPAYPQLKAGELQALYAYISLSPHPLQPEAQSLEMPLATGAKLYRYVMQSLSEAGCVHCHGAGPHSGEEVARIFGMAPQNFFMTAQAIEARSRPALENKADCQDSTLVERLEWRVVEQLGNGAPQRGMPLTGEPLSPAAISTIRQWSRLGCPNGKEFLCTPCRTGQS